MQDQLTLWPAEKQCSKCGQVKPIEAFQRRPERPSGYRSHCKACVAEPTRERARKQRALKGDELNADRRAKYREVRPYVRPWKLEPEVRRAHRRENARRWFSANPERARLLMRRAVERRRARLRGVQYIEHVDPLVVLERHDGACGICGGDVDPLRFHVDHIVPLSKGGEHSYRNTQPAHPVCNVRKGAMAP